ncbi:MAG: DUF484 family protein [Proteobacteria bacterium]|nr:DUF484 family protein [Pseudomonadota bacterium]
MTAKSLTDNDIIMFLNNNQDFFLRHPEQIEALNVANKNGTVTSLVNHQINVLKQRNNSLKTKLNELITYAAENEKLMSQIFDLSLQLCQISHIANVTKHFSRFVKKSFNAEMMKIVVPEYTSLESSSYVLTLDEEKKEKFLLIFAEFMHNNTPICGRLKQDKLNFIFGRRAEEINSSVILPIGDNAAKGLLVFASLDENRFHPEMSTDLLTRLCNILECKFSKNISLETSTSV